MITIMRGCGGAWVSPAAELAASQNSEVLRLSALQHHETFLIRWVYSFEEQLTVRETANSLDELLLTISNLEEFRLNCCGLRSPGAQDIQKIEKNVLAKQTTVCAVL